MTKAAALFALVAVLSICLPAWGYTIETGSFQGVVTSATGTYSNLPSDSIIEGTFQMNTNSFTTTITPQTAGAYAAIDTSSFVSADFFSGTFQVGTFQTGYPLSNTNLRLGAVYSNGTDDYQFESSGRPIPGGYFTGGFYFVFANDTTFLSSPNSFDQNFTASASRCTTGVYCSSGYFVSTDPSNQYDVNFSLSELDVTSTVTTPSPEPAYGLITFCGALVMGTLARRRAMGKPVE